jgi:hypothetical protein
MISVLCPSCNRVHKAPESIVGKWVQCKDCTASFQVQRASPQEEEIDILAACADPTLGLGSGERGPIQVIPSATGPRRRFGLVWVVFYWALAGMGLVVGGCIIALKAGAWGGSNERVQAMLDPAGLGDFGKAGGLAAALPELIGLALFHFGLLLMVTAYGLWTLRRWGLSLAKVLAVAFVALNAICVVMAVIAKAGIVAGSTGLVIAMAMLVYLYGGPNVLRRLRQYLPGKHANAEGWQVVE